MNEGYGSTQSENTWIGPDGVVTNHDPNTEMGFWVRLFHNECDRAAHLEREVQRLEADCRKWRDIAAELHARLIPDFEDDEATKAGVYAIQAYEKAADCE